MLCTDGSGGESKNDLCTKSVAIIIITSVQIHYNNIIIVTLLALRWLTPPVAVVEVPAVLWPLVPPVVVVRPLFQPVVVVIVVQRRSWSLIQCMHHVASLSAQTNERPFCTAY